MEIWTTPHGFLKAAAANNATSQPATGGSDVSFTVGGTHRYVGRINARNQVERVQTSIDNAVLGDTPVEITYSDYRDFGGVMFPARIQRTQGGHPALDITVSKVAANPAVEIVVPDPVRNFAPPAVNVEMEKLAGGVCSRHLSNRTACLDSQGALAAGLPIGSGEIESGHRYIIQSRLKRAEAWWILDNLENMLVLRVLRANREWENYWSQVNRQAA